ncbi:MAG: diacylglycerol kinase family lipid kinase [Lachnospiraceae bacterium]|nr:diacylglycerol kinase family lipid kinase [Lachnospiraceae bacterium]
MSRKLLFICNPYAGKSGIKHHLSEILDVFINSGYRVEIHLTQSVGDATKIVSERGQEFSRIVCGGGDGTLNETVSGLMCIPQEHRPSLGYIPAGTQNDYARNLGIPFGYAKAAAIACGAETHRIDVGRMNNGFFNYVCGFGAFTEVSYETRQEVKNLLGVPAYGLEAVKSFMHLKPYHLTVSFNGREITDDFMIILVGNSISIGGIKGILGDKVVMDDGLFEVFMVTNPSGIAGWNDVIGNIFQDHGENPTVHRFKTKQIEFFSEEKLKWVKDGEYAGDLNYVKISNEQKAIEFACRD